MAITTYTIPAEKIVHNTSVDFSSRFSIINPIHIVQYDNSLPIISVELKNDNKTYVLPTNIEVWIRWKKQDNTFVRKQALGCNSERNTVYFEITQQMVMQYGSFKPVVELIIPSDGSDPSVASSGYFSVLVDRNPIQNGDIESMTEYEDPYKTVCYTKEQVDNLLNLLGTKNFSFLYDANGRIFSFTWDKDIKSSSFGNQSYTSNGYYVWLGKNVKSISSDALQNISNIKSIKCENDEKNVTFASDYDSIPKTFGWDPNSEFYKLASISNLYNLYKEKLNDASSSVLSNHIANSAVTESKIANLAVTNSKLASKSVTTQKIADLAITNTKLADSAVTSTKLYDGCVKKPKIADSAITSSKLASESVTYDKFAKDAKRIVNKSNYSYAMDGNFNIIKVVTSTNIGGGTFSSNAIVYIKISKDVTRLQSGCITAACTNLKWVYITTDSSDITIDDGAIPSTVEILYNNSFNDIDYAVRSLLANNNKINSLSSTKYDSSNIEEGSCSLTPYDTSAPYIKSAKCKYTKIGKRIICNVKIILNTFVLNKNSSIHFIDLPFQASMDEKTYSVAFTSRGNIRCSQNTTGTWLTITNNTTSNISFVEDDTIDCTLIYNTK